MENKKSVSNDYLSNIYHSKSELNLSGTEKILDDSSNSILDTKMGFRKKKKKKKNRPD